MICIKDDESIAHIFLLIRFDCSGTASGYEVKWLKGETARYDKCASIVISRHRMKMGREIQNVRCTVQMTTPRDFKKVREMLCQVSKNA